MKIQENLFGINRTQITADCADKRKLKLADKNLGVKRILISSQLESPLLFKEGTKGWLIPSTRDHNHQPSMNKLFNHKNQKYLRQHLRSSMPKGEILLWQELKNKQFDYKFRRQYGINNYVIDFYCPKIKLGIEIDGSTHHQNDQINYEEQRQKHIESKGIRLERFNSQEIFEDINSVINQIYVLCKEQEGKLFINHPHNPSLKRRGGKGQKSAFISVLLI